MRGMLSVWVLGLLLQSTACAPECKPGEARSGDKCLKVTAHDGGDGGDEGDHGDDSHVGRAGGDDAAAVANDDASASASACEGAGCVVDACNPNPCGHGTCSLTADGFECACEPDWQGDGVCNVNTDASLVSLEVSQGALAPAFDTGVSDYTVDVRPDSPEVSILPIVAQPDGVIVSIDGRQLSSLSEPIVIPVPLNGEGVSVALKVQASAGQQRTYILSLRRTLTVRGELRDRAQTGMFGDATTRGGSGRAIALRGGFLSVGTPLDPGHVDVYARAGTTWTYRTILKPAYGAPGAGFGASLAVNEEWLAVAAPDSNVVYAYQRSRLLDGPSTSDFVEPADSGAAKGFGTALALSQDVMVVGAPRESVLEDGVAQADAGAFYVYELSASKWRLARRLTAPRAVAGAACGVRVAVEQNLIAVGCPFEGLDAGTGLPAGAVYLYERKETGWEFATRLQGLSPSAFGAGVDISNGRVAVGTLYTCATACVGAAQVYVFSKTGADWHSGVPFGVPWGVDASTALDPLDFGSSGLAFHGKRILVGAYGQRLSLFGVASGEGPASLEGGAGGGGAAYLFEESGNTWGLAARLGPARPSNPAEQCMNFGASVVLDEGTIAIAAPTWEGLLTGSPGTGAGVVYLFGADCSKLASTSEVPGCGD